MDTTEIIVIVVAILAGVFIGLPQLLERRGSLWKDMAEEREVALKETQQREKEALQRVRELEIRTDLSALSKDVSEGREQAVLAVKAEITHIQRSIIETEERLIASHEAHEHRAQERHEKVLKAFDAVTKRLES